MLTIYHNPRCSKSRDSICILEERKAEYKLVEYLVKPPTEKQLISLIKKLGITAFELMRKNEDIFLEKYAGKKMSEAACIKAMLKYPILIERPIIVKGNKAIIGRPPERVLKFL